jgi:uncharacterized protein YjiS (DUF1127 family)
LDEDFNNMFDIARLAASVKARVGWARSGAMTRRAIVPLRYTDERLLRDIGLSRADVIDDLSSPLGRITCNG